MSSTLITNTSDKHSIVMTLSRLNSPGIHDGCLLLQTLNHTHTHTHTLTFITTVFIATEGALQPGSSITYRCPHWPSAALSWIHTHTHTLSPILLMMHYQLNMTNPCSAHGCTHHCCRHTNRQAYRYLCVSVRLTMMTVCDPWIIN